MEVIILAVIYFGLVHIIWKATKFTQPRKAILATTLLPVFFVSMFLNIWLVDTLLPDLFNAYIQAQESSETLIEQGVSGRRASMESGSGFYSMMLAVPLALIISGLWFFILYRWEQKSSEHD